jgi:hypothetical protein
MNSKIIWGIEMNTNHCKKHYRPRGLRLVGWIFLGIAGASLFALVFAIAVKLLWNWLVPQIFGLAMIDYWQAFGLIVLARLLVGGWHHGHNHGERSPFASIRRRKEPFSDGIPEEIKSDPEMWRRYWDSEGRKGFEDFMKKFDKPEK